MKKYYLASIVVLLVVISFFTGCKTSVENKTKTTATYKAGGIEIPKSSQPAEVKAPERISKEMPENSVPTIISDEVVTADTGGGIYNSSDTYNDTPILTVVAKPNGFEITKYHNPDWWYVSIKITNKTDNIECAYITTSDKDCKDVDAVGNPTADTYFYPFTHAGDTYKIHLEKQEEGYSNWGTSNDVEATAVGGEGDFCITNKGCTYNPDNLDLIFTNLAIKIPESIKADSSVGGGIYDGGSWTGKSIWPYGYQFDDSVIHLADNDEAKDFLTGKSTVFVTLHYNYGVWNDSYSKWFSYEAPIISSVVYNSSTLNASNLIKLTGTDGSKLPKIYLSTNSGYKTDSGYGWHYGTSWRSGETITIEDEKNPLTLTSVSMKDRGNSTMWTDKVPYSIKFDTKTSVLGMYKSKRWVLMANYFDRSLIRTDFAGYINNNVFNTTWNASFTPVNIYLNGNFAGTYDLGESNKIQKGRVHIQSLEDYADWKTDKSVEYKDVNEDGEVNIEDAGFIVEIDTACDYAERCHFYSSQYTLPFTLKDPDFSDTTKYPDCDEYLDYASSKINAFEDMLVKDDFEEHYLEYIEPVSFIDWYLINEFAKNSDAIFQKSVPVTYNPKIGKLQMGPCWDFDLGFGNYDNTDCNLTEGWYIHGAKKYCDENATYQAVHGNYYECWWLNRLFESEDFKKAVKLRWQDRRLYLKNAINEQLIEYANMVYDSIPDNEAILPRLGQYSWNGPSGYASRTTYEDEITYLYDWCMARYNWMDEQISGW